MRLLILGAGQYGTVAKEVAEAMGIYSQISFLDDHSELAIGKLDDIDKVEYDAAFVAIGNPEVRSKLLSRAKELATLIHPNSTISESAIVEKGSIVEAGAVICANAKIDRGCIIMANAVVGHDAQVGECCQLKYNCTIPERCVVPSRTKVDCNIMFG